MQEKTENFSIRFVAIFLLVLFAICFLGYWYVSPYLATNSIKNAIKTCDKAKMSKFIDFPAVRFNIQKQINNQIDVKMQELQSKPLTPSSHLDVYAFHAVDEVLRNIVTEEGIAELISGRKKLVEKSKDCELKDFGGNLKAITVGNKPEETGDLDVDMEYGDDFDSFDVTLSEKSNPAEKVTVTLSREGFFFWQVTNVLLPFKPVAGS